MEELRAQLQLHREHVSSARRPALWRELKAQIATHVNLHNVMTSASPGQHIDFEPDLAGDSLIVSRPRYPHARVEVAFVEKRLIELKYAYRKTPNADKITWEEHIAFYVDDLDRVYFEVKGNPVPETSEVMLHILRPLTDAVFVPPA